MVQNKRGLIVNVSSYGGLEYIDTAPYGIGKVWVWMASQLF